MRRLVPALLLLAAACATPAPTPPGPGPVSPVDRWRDWAARNPGAFSSRLLHAYDALAAGDWAKYQREVEPMAELAGTESGRLLALGTLHLNAVGKAPDLAGRMAQAEAARAPLEKALEARPDDGDAAVNLAAAHRMAGRTDAAASVLESYVRRKPDDAAALRLLGRIHFDREDWPAALRTSGRITPSAATAPDHAFRGLTLFHMSRFDEAEAAFKAAIELDPRDASSWHNLSLVYRELGKLDKAKECESKVRELR